MSGLQPISPSIPALGETVMPDATMRRRISRRNLLKAMGLTATAVGIAPSLKNQFLGASAVHALEPAPSLKLIGTDGWISLPSTPAIAPFHPDVYAPDGLSTYIFGFRNATGLDDTQLHAQKNHAQHSAPLFWAKEGEQFIVNLTNVGLAQRPDLFDAHTLHWHGFKNVLAFFDGEPTGSVSVPAGQSFSYVYMSHDPGTYMYHCHVEDVEHVQMGMTGLVFVRPKQDTVASAKDMGLARPINKAYKGFAYNDGDGSTGYDREYAMFLSEVWAEAHWADAHIQLPEWSDYRADFSLLNGRVYPDTLERNSPNDAYTGQPYIPVSRDPEGELVVPPAAHLQHQPLSSLITCEPGEDVLLRFANLGFKEASMTLTGIKLRVVGRDATLLKGRTGTSGSYTTNTLSFGAGESFDTVFRAPAHSGGTGPDKYVLFNRTYTRSDNLAGGGGQRTEVHVYPTGTLAAQQFPNDWGR
jgi:FtsP/CotA-like multicopper oxidase with cupredoxin domain